MDSSRRELVDPSLTPVTTTLSSVSCGKKAKTVRIKIVLYSAKLARKTETSIPLRVCFVCSEKDCCEPAAVGLRVDGAAEGANVKVGVALGTMLGTKVGIKLGVSLGVAVGLIVGVALGNTVGAVLGT